MKPRFVPVFSHHPLRMAAGLLLAVLSPVLAASLLGAEAPGIVELALFALLAWLPAIWLTDKYRHKYPQRYDTYLLASHLKAAVIMAPLMLVVGLATGRSVSWAGFAAFVLLDALLSLPRRRAASLTPRRPAQPAPVASSAPATLPSIDAAAAIRASEALLDPPALALLREHLPGGSTGAGDVVVLDDLEHGVALSPSALLVGRIRLNDVRRLNLFLGHCADRTAMGGYALLRYRPLDEAAAELRRRYAGPWYGPVAAWHFLWYRLLPKTPYIERLYFHPALGWLDRLVLKVTGPRNRALPKAEVWGRLAFWGFDVVGEAAGEGDRLVLARRVSPPPANRRPSFFAVVALEKVGLDGELMRTHKVRSMYPFSEFLQRKIYESHGLTATGKFKNDFRLTEYGKLIRRHWIDELPGLYDWLHGEIKLVGMRATSAQFLSTYPAELYDLYIQTKPGLIPPIFDEKTSGFADIVRTELAYLTRYARAPIRTDVAYFWYTFRDIVFRRVRSF